MLPLAAPLAPLSFALIGNSTTNNSSQFANDAATTSSPITDHLRGEFSTSLSAIQVGRRRLVTVQFGHNDQRIAPWSAK
ncbi:hypothetical protein C8Q74DRAFT_503407 [Fomes fomentarius]|nr:hypothetical protein C8Q74DRAFT_503407 [Fomes fomentarius]